MRRAPRAPLIIIHPVDAIDLAAPNPATDNVHSEHKTSDA
jgi:hypothetical protein